MSTQGAYGLIGLTVCILAIVALGGIRADARAQAAHERWQRAYREWLRGGMKGPRP